jgi:hypothetical protein
MYVEVEHNRDFACAVVLYVRKKLKDLMSFSYSLLKSFSCIFQKKKLKNEKIC